MVGTSREVLEKQLEEAEAHGMDMSFNENYSNREFSDHPYEFDPDEEDMERVSSFYESF